MLALGGRGVHVASRTFRERPRMVEGSRLPHVGINDCREQGSLRVGGARWLRDKCDGFSEEECEHILCGPGGWNRAHGGCELQGFRF